MKRNKETRVLNRSAFAASLTASLCLGLAAPFPRVKEDQFFPDGDFGKQSQNVDDYWKTQVSK